MLGIGASTNVGLFGKVPSQPDFVRVNAGSPNARGWDEWVNLGLTELRRSWGTDWEARFDASPPLHFVARPTNDPRQVLAGHLCPSMDKSGRRYPLTVFCEFQLDRQGRGVQVLPHALEGFLAAAVATTQSSHSPDGASVRLLEGLVPENPIELGRSLADHLRAVTMESFWSAVLGGVNDDRKYLIIKNLFTTLAPLRGFDPARLAMGLRFPGSPTTGAVAPSTVMAAWSALCRAVAGEETLAKAWLFWHVRSDGRRAGCYLFFRPPPVTALAALLDSDHATESIWEMESMGADRIKEARDALGPAISSVLDAPRFAFLEFIQRI